MTKAQQILDLYPQMYAEHGPDACRLIGEIVGCRKEYVRIVARQRKGSGCSEIDFRYRRSPLGIKMISLRKPKDRSASLVRYLTGDRDQARSASKATYRASRAQGMSRKEAHRLAFDAYTKTMRATGDRAAARAAYAATPPEPLP